MQFLPPLHLQNLYIYAVISFLMDMTFSLTTCALINWQIQQWEQNLERFNIDLFRMRCYLASRQGEELPNPKSLLATANRSSKAAVARLGIFSVSSFHALVSFLDLENTLFLVRMNV